MTLNVEIRDLVLELDHLGHSYQDRPDPGAGLAEVCGGRRVVLLGVLDASSSDNAGNRTIWLESEYLIRLSNLITSWSVQPTCWSDPPNPPLSSPSL